MKTIVIAPHPDDEVLGVGGTLLRRKAEGAEVAWLIVTHISSDNIDNEKKELRAAEISRVANWFNFDSVFELKFPAADLDRIPMQSIVGAVSSVFNSFEPNEVFIPHYGDVHSDHRIVFDALASCTKWFRYPSVKRVLAYETLSETGFGLKSNEIFRPNVYVDITAYLESKLQVMNFYASEVGRAPFPRSCEAIQALATLRGSASGFSAAEAFELLRERL